MMVGIEDVVFLDQTPKKGMEKKSLSTSSVGTKKVRGFGWFRNRKPQHDKLSEKTAHTVCSSVRSSVLDAPTERHPPSPVRMLSNSMTSASYEQGTTEFAEFSNDATHSSSSSRLPDISYVLERNPKRCMGYLRFQDIPPDSAKSVIQTQQRPIFFVRSRSDDMEDGPLERAREILTHPLISEALESFFTPVFVNLQEHEGSESNEGMEMPSTGFIDINPDTGRLQVTSLPAFDLSQRSLLQAMRQVLQTRKHPVPAFLELLWTEIESMDRRKTAYFGICGEIFRSELPFSGVPGILATRIRRRANREDVLQVTYDPQHLKFCEIVRLALNHTGTYETIYCQTNDEMVAARMESSRRVSLYETKKPAVARLEPGDCDRSCHSKFPLRQTPLKFVPLTMLQWTRTNWLVHDNRFNEAIQLLSPRQGRILMDMTRCAGKEPLVDTEIEWAWARVRGNEHLVLDTTDSDMSEDQAPEMYNCLPSKR